MVTVLLAVALLGATPVAAGPLESVRATIEEAIEEGTTPSLAVAVFRNGEILWEEGFGWADAEQKVPATPHTPFSLASISKPITATALMILVERRQVDLDRPIEDYLGGLTLTGRADRTERATVRRVASHTAGLPLHHRFFFDSDDRPSFEETVRQYGVLVHPAGQEFQYSNLGYRLLERLIEEVAPTNFASFMAREIFGPLGMEHSAVVVRPDEGPLAVRYDRDGKPIPFYSTDHDGGSAVFACVHDMARFGSFHLGRLLPGQVEIIGRRSRQEMRRRVARRAFGGQSYGLGWAVELAPQGYTIVSHTGGMPGTSTALILVPVRNLVIAVAAGSRTDLPVRVSREILRTYERVAPAWAITAGGPWGMVTPSGTGRPTRQLVGTWSGVVETGPTSVPLRLEIERSGKVLAFLGDDGRSLPVRLTRFASREFSGWLVGDLPTNDLAGRSYVLRLDLRLGDEGLTGVVTAVAQPAEALPFALSHWAALEPVE